MGIISSINEALGITNISGKQALAIQISKSLSALEDWMEANFSEDELVEYMSNHEGEFADALSLTPNLLVRIVKRTNIDPDDESMTSKVNLAHDILVLKYVLAYELGFRLSDEKVVRSAYPHLDELANLDKNMLLVFAQEAINSVMSLNSKYPS